MQAAAASQRNAAGQYHLPVEWEARGPQEKVDERIYIEGSASEEAFEHHPPYQAVLGNR